MYTQVLTIVHVAISLIAIALGIVVAVDLVGGHMQAERNKWVLVMTAATTLTGFLFPFHGATPAFAFGILTAIVLSAAFCAKYPRHAAGAWRGVYIIAAMFAFYLNFFVLVAQAFQKAPALAAIAPTQNAPGFLIGQVVVLGVFIAMTVMALKAARRPA